MNSKNTFPEVLWAGTEHSLALAMEAHDRMMAGAFSDDEEDDGFGGDVLASHAAAANARRGNHGNAVVSPAGAATRLGRSNDY
jgi:hypothetical protein